MKEVGNGDTKVEETNGDVKKEVQEVKEEVKEEVMHLLFNVADPFHFVMNPDPI